LGVPFFTNLIIHIDIIHPPPLLITAAKDHHFSGGGGGTRSVSSIFLVGSHHLHFKWFRVFFISSSSHP
jgi:hypothetical protein